MGRDGGTRADGVGGAVEELGVGCHVAVEGGDALAVGGVGAHEVADAAAAFAVGKAAPKT